MANITVSTTRPAITVDSTNNIITVSDSSSNVSLGPVVSGTLANTIATSGRFETLEVGNVTTVQYQFPVDAPTVDQGLRAYANGTLYWSEDVGLVDSVNGYTGDVVLDTADLQENGNLFWTTDRGNATISAYTGDMLSINNITASYISVSNDISATNNVSGQYFNGNVNGTTGDFTGNISADTLNGNISGDTGVFTGNVDATTFNGDISGDTGVFTGNVDATNFNGDVFGSISGATGVFTGNIDTSGVLNTNTISPITGDTVTINGELEITGNTNTVNIQDLQVEDHKITLNYGNATARDAFLYVDRSGSGLGNSVLQWDETDDRWDLSNGLVVRGDITSADGNLILGYNNDLATPSYITTQSATVGNGLLTNELGITLNHDYVTQGDQNAGFGVYEGSGNGVYILWNATDNKWTFTNDGGTYYPIPTNTTDLIEGANLYYTDARVQSNTAADTGLVHTTGNETVGGIKSFTSELKVAPNTATFYNDAYLTVGGDSQQAEIRIVEYNGTNPGLKSGSSMKAFANRGTEANVDYVFDHDGVFRFEGRGRSQSGALTPGNFFGFNVDDGDRTGRVPVHTEIKAFTSAGAESSGITITGAQYTDGARFYAKNSLVAKTDTAYATDTFVIGNSDPYQHTPPTANLTIGHNTDTQTENLGITYWYQYGGTLSEFPGAYFGLPGYFINYTATGAGELPANTVCVEFQTSVRHQAEKLFRGSDADGRWAGEYIADGTAVTIKGTPTDLAANANNQTYYLKALGEFDFFGSYGEHFYALYTDAALTTPLSWEAGGLNAGSLPPDTPGGDYRGYGEITYSPGDFSKFIKTSEYTTTGSGTGAEFFVSKKGSTYKSVGSNYVRNSNAVYNRKGFTLSNYSLAGGSGFAVNDTVEIDGALLGGISGTNNLTFTIDSINGSGGVTSVGNISGTAFNMTNDAWNFTKSHTDTNLYLSKEGTLHTTFGDTTTTAVGNIDANNLNATNTITSDTATFTGNVSTGNISTSILTATSADLTGNITVDTLNGNVNGDTGVFTGNVDGLTFNGNINGATGDFTGNISADTLNGNISGATGDFTGNVDATTFNGNVNGTTGDFTGNISADTLNGNVNGATGVFTGNVDATTFNGDISGTTGDFTGNVSASVVLSDRLQSQIDSGADIEYNNPSQRWDIARGLFVDGSIQNFSTISGYDLTATANVSGADLIASNNVSGQYFNGNVSGTTGVFTGNVDASAFNGDISGATGDFTGAVTALSFSGEGSDLTDVRAETLEVNIKNVSGGNIAKGTPVHQIASSGADTLNVIPADASNAATMPAHAIAGEDLIDEQEGRGIISGRISGVDTSLFQPGDTIYVAVGGGYANVAPTGEANLIQNLGTVTKIDALTGGGEVFGAGRTNATPNLDDGKFFLGNAANQAATSDFTDEANSVILNYTGDITAMNTANAVSFNGNIYGSIGNITTVNATDVNTTNADITTATVDNIHLTQFDETVIDLGTTNGDISSSLDVSLGTIFQVTANGNITINSMANAVAGTSATIVITQDGTGDRLLSSTMKFSSGGFKTLSTANADIDIMSVFYDGSTYYATLTTGYA